MKMGKKSLYALVIAFLSLSAIIAVLAFMLLMPSPPNIPNPASGNCVDVDGTPVVREFPLYENQVGVCVFPDGSECIQWDLFYGDCFEGQHNRVRFGYECSVNHGCSDTKWDKLDDALGSRPRKIYSGEGYEDISGSLVNQCCEPLIEYL